MSPEARVIEGDCREVMAGMDAESVDAIVTDPPYGIGFKYGSYVDDPEDFPSLMRGWIAEAERIVKPGGAVFVWHGQPQIPNMHKWLPDKYRVFAACKNFVQIYPGPMYAAWDPVVVWWKQGGKPYSKRDASRDWLKADTTPSGRKRRGEAGNPHPCPRPIEHTDHIVSQWVSPGGIVLDPFAGSGNIGISCAKHSMGYIGIEIDPDYAEIARQRIQGAT